MAKKEILVVIPWLPSEAQGGELRYAVAGWQKHFKERHRIVVVGDGVTGLVPPGVDAVESPRVPEREGMYRQHLDYVSCLRRVRQLYPETTGLIMVADDCYAVNDFDMVDVLLLKQQNYTFNGDAHSPNGWLRDKWRTAQALRDGGYQTRNCTTHLPQWFEWKKLEALWDRFHMDSVSYTIEDLYYNIYYNDRVFFQLNVNDAFKFGVNDASLSADLIKKEMARKIWIANSPPGWSATLSGVLEEHYFQ